MNKKQLICLLGLTTTFTAQADFLSVSVGGGIWNESPGGDFKRTSDPIGVDVSDNLFWDTESQGYFFATLEHFIPLVPNVRLIHTQIDHSGSGDSGGFVFDGKTYNADISNDTSIETTDLIVYYEVLDNVVSLDLGINIRTLNIDYNIIDNTDPTNNAKDSFSETVPMLYALVGTSPWPGLRISGEVSYIAFSGSSVSDITAKVSYTTDYFVGVEAGYRKQAFTLDDVSGYDMDLTFDGIFAGAYLKF